MGSNGVVNDITEDFPATGIGVEAINLHVRSCVHHFKCLLDMNFMDSSDHCVKRSVLGSDYVCIAILASNSDRNCSLVLL